MSKYKIMTPGPVQVPENVRLARSLSTTNADLDPQFYDEYKETCELISELLHTKNETLILSGEGILGLEAACASMTEPGDRVLILDNGIYGAGFADFVSMYGGTPVMYTKDYKNAFDVDELDAYLKEDHDFKYATVIHCDSPKEPASMIPCFSLILSRISSAVIPSGTSNTVTVSENPLSKCNFRPNASMAFLVALAILA